MVIIAISDYNKFTNQRLLFFNKFCDKVDKESEAKGMNEAILQEIPSRH